MTLPYEDVLRRLGSVADRLGLEAYCVGGAVRDALLGRATSDLDFVSVGPGSGIHWAKAVAKEVGVRTAHVYANFGTAGVHLPPEQYGGDHDDAPLVLEFVGARRESYDRSSRKPAVEDGTLDDDQRRRDFTINALAVCLNGAMNEDGRFGELVDPFGGLSDLAAGLLRTPLDPAETFSDDPLRMLRAARFAAQLGFRVDDDALAAMRQHADRIAIVSQERITDELQKLLAAPVPSVGFKILYDTGLLDRILPDLTALAGVEEVRGHKHKDNFFHTLEVVDNLAHLQQQQGVAGERAAGEALWTRWAALFHDIAKPDTKRFIRGRGWTFHGHEDRGARRIPKLFRALKLPMDERLDHVRELVRLHHRPVALVDDEVTDSAVRRLLFEAGDRIDALMRLVRADITSKNPRRVRRYLNAFDRVEAKFVEVEEKDRLRNFQPPVDGYEIMETLGVTEGVAVGIVKEHIREAILDGAIPNEHDAAFAYMMAMKDEALRRGALFETVIRTLQGREKAAIGAIKEELFWGDVPEDPNAAHTHLMRVKDEALAERFGEEA
ncbi:MAG: HD domain-containing protein [Bacteroidota bacterium]